MKRYRYIAPVRNFCLMIGIVCVLLIGLEASARIYYLFRTDMLTNHPEIDKSGSWRVDYSREFKESGDTRSGIPMCIGGENPILGSIST